MSLPVPTSPITRPRYWQAPAVGQQPPRYQVGVDGGGTNTRLRLADSQGRIIGQGQAGPSALGQGVEQAWLHLGHALREAAAQAGLVGLGWQQCAVGLGLSGVSVPGLAERFLAMAPRCGLLAVDTDGFAGVLGAHAGRPGAVVVAGTGSVGEALWADGQRKAVGGCGWLNGDEGSGAWLGKSAMRHAQRAMDGRDPAGALARAVWSIVGPQPTALLDWALAAHQQRFATLAPLVFEHEANDPAAAALMAEALRELHVLAQALDPSGQLPICLSGSVALRLEPRLNPSLRARCVPPQGDAVDGALRLIHLGLEMA